MKRYLFMMGHPQRWSATEADLIAEDYLAAIRVVDHNSEAGPPKEYISHPPNKASGFQAHSADILHVYELPGEPLEQHFADDVSARFLESLGVKVAIIERIR
jgi:hypothetical protein